MRIRNSGVRNYDIGAGTLVEEVVRLECRGESAFGNGTEVAVMNENGGRTVRIYSGLTAQIAYMAAVYRHRPALVAAPRPYGAAGGRRGTPAQGSIGRDCRITDCRLLRDVGSATGATLEGVSVPSNGTVGNFSRIGIDVKAYDFVTAEHALVDNGSLIERCFIGERCIFDRGYTASDSLFFANSHCENGEAVSIFAGPYTVSHHKSSLLIAGMFLLLQRRQRHQPEQPPLQVRRRASGRPPARLQFASGAYVMSPAIEGVYTMIMGRHTHHHDTSVFLLLPAGTGGAFGPAARRQSVELRHGARHREVAAARQTQRRPRPDQFRDLESLRGQRPRSRPRCAPHALRQGNPDAQSFIYNSVHIKLTKLRRGIQR